MSEKKNEKKNDEPTYEVGTPYSIAAQIVVERENQIARWGEQNHPCLHNERMRRDFTAASEEWHRINDARVEDGTLSWDGILLEEVFEALAEPDPLLRREELIQVAAVAAAEIEAIDRRLAKGAYEAAVNVALEEVGK